jgi:hypothetical protein
VFPGLLKDGLRKYWLDQIRSLEATKAKASGKSQREIEALDMVRCALTKRGIQKKCAFIRSVSIIDLSNLVEDSVL